MKSIIDRPGYRQVGVPGARRGWHAGKIIIQKRLRRSQVEAFFRRACRRRWIGIEACGSAHHWARMLRAQGHEVRLIPAAYVKPFVRRNKTDARDAAAICAALAPAGHALRARSRASSSRRRAVWNGRASCWSSSIRS